MTQVTPLAGVGIEIVDVYLKPEIQTVTPLAGVGIEIEQYSAPH